jgi:hypothetical protein
MEPLPLGDIGATPWFLSPWWFVAAALIVPAIAWLAFAWHRALSECPNRVRRAGIKEMQRLMRTLQRNDTLPRSTHLHAWLRAAARAWGVRTSAPCASEISQAAQLLTGDATVSTRWRELCSATEHGLYAADVRPMREWLEHAATAARSVEMPKRERTFPNRLRHWLPTLAVLLIVAGVPLHTTRADVPLSSPTYEDSAAAELTPDVGEMAQAALEANWNDWAAHRNLAAFEAQEGASNLAIAHATAAFVQHPASTTGETLRVALGETPTVDTDLRRLLSGSWYQRIPTLLSPAGWQRVALIAALVIAASLSILAMTLYSPRFSSSVSWARGGMVAGALALTIAIGGWSGYGLLNQPAAAILVQAADVSPVPTDLVPQEETSPLTAGTVVLIHRSFLGWRQISSGTETSGWIRSGAVMPLYASR